MRSRREQPRTATSSRCAHRQIITLPSSRTRRTAKDGDGGEPGADVAVTSKATPAVSTVRQEPELRSKQATSERVEPPRTPPMTTSASPSSVPVCWLRGLPACSWTSVQSTRTRAKELIRQTRGPFPPHGVDPGPSGARIGPIWCHALAWHRAIVVASGSDCSGGWGFQAAKRWTMPAGNNTAQFLACPRAKRNAMA